MADETGNTSDLNPDALTSAAERVLDNLAELEPELVGAAIFRDEAGSDAPAGTQTFEPVSVNSVTPGWAEAAGQVLAAVKAASSGEQFDSAHIAGTEGEVFVVSEAGLSLVAVTGRFVLASLTSYDIRMALRDVAGSKSAPGARNGGSGHA